jgi:hypothetical protein
MDEDFERSTIGLSAVSIHPSTTSVPTSVGMISVDFLFLQEVLERNKNSTIIMHL